MQRGALHIVLLILLICHSQCFTFHSTSVTRPHARTTGFHRSPFSPVQSSSSSSSGEQSKPPQENKPKVVVDIVVAETSRGLQRVSWLSWWCQIVLTVTSAVILSFAKNVAPPGNRGPQANFFLAGTGIIVSFLSIFWTWGGEARLSRRLTRRPTSRIQAANLLRRAIEVGVSLNLVGMGLTLLGAEQTVGVLAIKVLTARPWNNPAAGGMYMAGGFEGLQPLDILIVQANTNALLSHFCSLVSLLYLTRFIKKLDPPSEDESSGINKKKKKPKRA